MKAAAPTFGWKVAFPKKGQRMKSTPRAQVSFFFSNAFRSAHQTALEKSNPHRAEKLRFPKKVHCVKSTHRTQGSFFFSRASPCPYKQHWVKKDPTQTDLQYHTLPYHTINEDDLKKNIDLKKETV